MWYLPLLCTIVLLCWRRNPRHLENTRRSIILTYIWKLHITTQNEANRVNLSRVDWSGIKWNCAKQFSWLKCLDICFGEGGATNWSLNCWSEVKMIQDFPLFVYLWKSRCSPCVAICQFIVKQTGGLLVGSVLTWSCRMKYIWAISRITEVSLSYLPKQY